MAIYKTIEYKQAIDFILPLHYSGRKPQITVAFGAFIDDELKAVCTFGKPASPSLCIGILGKEHSDMIYELNRLCRVDDYNEPLSRFVAFCLKELSKNDWVIVSYSDTDMGHNGYIYQACNFIYTGKTKERTDKWTDGNKHSRHYSNDDQGQFRKIRSSKHRYVYFCVKNKANRKRLIQLLKYPVLEYPKGENKNYVLGQYQQPKIINTTVSTEKEDKR